MANVNYEVDYNDKRFKNVEAEQKQELTEVEKTYGGMIKQSDKFYQDQINASKAYAAQQKKNQQAQTDFAIQKIEQQKAEAKKDYTRETAGAYADWQKQSNAYGAKAEQNAAMGMANSGYSESSQVAMFNTYQNRVATARESYNLTVMNFNNAITEARLQNNSALAEIAYKAQQQQLELALNGFQYKNQLVIEKANKKSEVKQTYYQRYRDVLSQINTENALAEEVRQYNESKALEREKMAQQKAIADAQLAEEIRQFNVLHSSSGSSGGGSSGGSGRVSSKKTSSKSSSSSGSGSVKKSDGAGATKKSSSPSVDMKSVLNLGYGPISASQLDKLVRAGAVKETEKNGKLTYTKSLNRYANSLGKKLVR